MFGRPQRTTASGVGVGGRLLIAVAADVIAVLVFVVLGRRSHDGGSGVVAVLATAAPFLVALGVGWIVVLVARLAPLSVLAGVVLWAITVAGGLVLRRTAWDRGTAASFVVVAAIALGLLIVGWRSVVTFTRGAGAVASASPPFGAGR
ncbi:MAG: DUF3054 domain-containing protein [Ilumatobacteraceae bacterium]